MISYIKFATIFVKDQEAALAFYRDALGFAVTTDVSYEGGRWIELTLPGNQTMITLCKSESIPPPEFQGVVFSTPDIQATYATLVARGVKFTHPPEEQPWGDILTEFTDPDGNCFVLGQDAPA